MNKSFDKAVATCKELRRWQVSPYRCLYHNPHKYNTVEFARWTQRYQNYKIYQALLAAAKITGYEPVPAELLNRHVARDGYSGKKVRVGKVIFYLLKPDEMSSSLLVRYNYFKEIILGKENGENGAAK